MEERVMTPSVESPTMLTDVDLIVRLRALARDERRATVQLIAGLAEFERRQLYFAQGFPSLFTYCTDALHFSEHAAYTRMEVARTALRFPLVLERLEDGSVTLTAVRRLGAVLTEANHREVLAAATHKKKADVEMLVATLRPRPDAATIVRKLPPPRASGLALQTAPAASVSSPPGEPSSAASAVASTAASPVGSSTLSTVASTAAATAESAVLDTAAARSASPPASVSALAPDRYRIQFTASRAMHDKLRLVQALIRHRIPTGDVAAIFERGLDLLLADLSRTKCAATPYPRNQLTMAGRSRHIPAAVKREVWRRDDGRCAFVGTEGRCSERGFLEFHHVVPFAKGGPATADNIQLRCRAHNTYEAVQVFGPLLAREVAPAYSPACDG
jgi:hypothetical protein